MKNLKLLRLIATLEEAEDSVAWKTSDTDDFISRWREQFENLIDGHSGWTFDAFYNIPLRDDNVIIHFRNDKADEGFWVHINTGEDPRYTEMKTGESDWASNIQKAVINRIFERA